MEPALKPLAECLSKGALAGRKIRLIGRTDPRGSDEYNMVLGQARANAVSAFLTNLGVPSDRLLTTSRGELDAKGTAEGGWAHDRRVDIELAD
jgi:peptidoglycan-associated lipoprotein